MSGTEPTPEGRRLSLDEWLTRYDDALLRGETPPRLEDVADADAARLREFLDMLDQTLRQREPTTIPSDFTVVGERTFETIGRFRIEEELGRGGFGVVFRAFDPMIGRTVALKVPRSDAVSDPDVRRRFLREAHAAAQLDHSNLVPLFEAGETEGVCYIASAYCEGPTLRRWIDDRRASAEPRAVARLVLGLARAVAHMHARGILHCDLKPGNILIEPPPSDDPKREPTPRVTDFGLARLIGAPIGDSTAARAWGTPPYMAPEQIEMRGEAIGPAADVYALGAVLYELLVGRPPHQGETTWEVMRSVVADPPTPPRSIRRSIPRDLCAIATRCLEKRPERRYRDAAALVDDLDRFLHHLPTLARPLGRPRRLVRWSARNPAAAALLVMTTATLLVSVAYTIALRGAVDELNRANSQKQAARERAERQEALAREALARAEAKSGAERRAHYAVVLAMAQQELTRGRSIQAQRHLRSLVPAEGGDEPDLRDFAWRYLWRQSRRECTCLDDLKPGGATCDVAAGDGLLFATSGGKCGSWRVFRPESAEVPAPVRPTFAFEPFHDLGGEVGRLAAAGDRVVVNFLSRAGGAGIAALDATDGAILGTLSGSRWWDRGLATTADLRLVAAGVSPEASKKLVEWKLDLGDREAVVLGVPGVDRVAFAPDGRRIVALRRTMHTGPTKHRRLLEFWNMETGLREFVDEAPVGPALAASPLPGGPIATGTLEGEVQLREPERGEVVAVLPSPAAEPDRVSCLAFAADGKTLAAGYNGMAVLWDVENRRELARIERLTEWVESIAFLDDPSGDVALGLARGSVVVWHAEPIEPAVVLDAHDDEVWGVKFVDGGRTLVTLGGEPLLKFWDVATGRTVAALPGHESWPSCLATAGDLIATADFGGEALIWNARERRLVRRIKAHEDRARAIALSPDGTLLATGGRDPVARLWDVATGAAAGTVAGTVDDDDPIGNHVRGLAFSPDGRALASAGENGLIRLWDVPTLREQGRMDAAVHVSCLAWSPDGRTLASGDVRGAVTLWDVDRGEARFRLPNLHRREVSGLAFSPDGRTLATAGQDRMIALVDVVTGLRHLTLAGHEAGVNAVAFSPDGRILASASHDRAVRLWWTGPESTSILPLSSAGL